MTNYKITTVAAGHNGSMGQCVDQTCLHFIDGVGYTENPAFIDYSATAGHAVDTVDSIPAEYTQGLIPLHPYGYYAVTAPAAAPIAEEWFATSPLRDAAVDPHQGDYLPPVNAGTADPHGPKVVSVQALSPRSGNPPYVDGARYEPATVTPNPNITTTAGE